MKQQLQNFLSWVTCRRWRIVALVGLAPFILGCRPSADEMRQPHVILVLVDTLRADRLGCYGYSDRQTTPHLDRFASAAVLFENAISQNGWTVPSVASLFTGVYPETHGVLRFIEPSAHDQGEGRVVKLESLSLEHTTIAEQFRQAGYETASILKSGVVNAGRGFEQGFDEFFHLEQKPKERGESAAHVTDAAIAWLRERIEQARPFFLYLHYMDPHASYMAPEPLYMKYGGKYDSQLDGAARDLQKLNDGEMVASPDDIERLSALYDEEIEYWDTQFGRLVEFLEAEGLYDRMIVAVTADHGEAFNEHDLFDHAGIFQENIHVPLLLRVPGVEARRFHTWVQMMDLGPTLAELAGVGRGEGWVARSHAASIRGGSPVAVASVFSQWAGQRCVIDADGMKLLVGLGQPRLYDLSRDPMERENLASSRPEELRRLQELLRQQAEGALSLRDRFPRSEQTVLTQDEVEGLKALGYLD